VPTLLFEEWRALYDLEPWADARADYAADEIVAALWATHGTKPKQTGHYMQFLKKPEPKPQTQKEMKAVLEAVCERMRGRDTRTKGPAPATQSMTPSP